MLPYFHQKGLLCRKDKFLFPRQLFPELCLKLVLSFAAHQIFLQEYLFLLHQQYVQQLPPDQPICPHGHLLTTPGNNGTFEHQP